MFRQSKKSNGKISHGAIKRITEKQKSHGKIKKHEEIKKSQGKTKKLRRN